MANPQGTSPTASSASAGGVGTGLGTARSRAGAPAWAGRSQQRAEPRGLGLLGRKVGMMRVFAEDGQAIPVTVIDVSNNRIAQIKSVETDGYCGVQVAYGERRATRVTKPMAGHFAKAGVQSGTALGEFRVTPDKLASYKAGEVIGPDLFEVGQKVDVQGRSQGKGFSGTIKRHNFNSGRASHGNSRSHNVPGSIGMAQDPGRVFPGKRMSGQYGNVTRTVQGLEVARVDTERGLLLIRGAVPGATGGEVVILPAARAPRAGAKAAAKA